jgi:hypothetical protein
VVPLQSLIMLSHALSLACNVPHVIFHTIKVVEGVREEFEVALDVLHEVAFDGLEVLGQGFIKELHISLGGDLEHS